MQEINDFEMNEIKMSPIPEILQRPIGYERQLVVKLTQKSHMDSPGPSFMKHTERLAIETLLIEPDSWTLWSDDKIEKAVVQAFSFKKAGPSLSFASHTERSAASVTPLTNPNPSTSSLDDQMELGVVTISSYTQTLKSIALTMNLGPADLASINASASGGHDRIPSKSTLQTVISAAETALTKSSTGSENQKKCKLPEVASLSPTSINPTVAEVGKSKLNRKKFVWNPNAPPFISRNLINNDNINLNCNRKIKSQNYFSIMNGIRTSDAPLPFLSAPTGLPIQIRRLGAVDVITLSMQSLPSIVHTASSQIINPFAQGDGDRATTAIPIQQTTSTAATTSRLNAMDGHDTSMLTYYKTSVAQTMPRALAAKATGSSGCITQTGGVGMSIYYQPPYYSIAKYNRQTLELVHDQQPVVLPSVAASAVNASPSRDCQTHAQLSTWSLWNDWWYNGSTNWLSHKKNAYPPR